MTANLIPEIIKIVQHEGECLKNDLARGLAIKEKSSTSDLVTHLDERTERVLREKLTVLLPDSGFWGEESGASKTSEKTWVVDPIDGTTNFVHGFPYSSIVVALLEDNKPVLGVVHNIFEGVTYFATLGNGAWQDKDGVKTQLHVSDTGVLAGSLMSFGLPYDRAKSSVILQAAGDVFSHVRDLRRTGSAALDIVNIAAGRTEAHFELDLRPWDILASSLILQEAGGVFGAWNGDVISSWDISDKIAFLATNGHLQNAMSEILSPLL